MKAKSACNAGEEKVTSRLGESDVRRKIEEQEGRGREGRRHTGAKNK